MSTSALLWHPYRMRMPITSRSLRQFAGIHGRYSKRFNRLAQVIERKLVQIHAANMLSDLALFPGNRLEALKGNRTEEHCIRINDQYRICFVWRDGDAFEVEIADYH